MGAVYVAMYVPLPWSVTKARYCTSPSVLCVSRTEKSSPPAHRLFEKASLAWIAKTPVSPAAASTRASMPGAGADSASDVYAVAAPGSTVSVKGEHRSASPRPQKMSVPPVLTLSS